jgi:hypothetical protein
MTDKAPTGAFFMFTICPLIISAINYCASIQ